MITNLQTANTIHSNIIKAQQYLLDLDRFRHATSIKGLLQDVDSSYSEVCTDLCSDEIKRTLEVRGAKFKFETAKLYLVSYCLNKIRVLMTEHGLDLSFLTEGHEYPKYVLELFTQDAKEWSRFRKIEVAIDELLPVMTVAKAIEATNCQRSHWKTPVPYVLNGLYLDDLIDHLRRKRGEVVRWIRNNKPSN